MKEIDITFDSFYSFKPLKKETVRKKGRLVYKYSPLSERNISILHAKMDEKVLKQLATPESKLKCKGTYFGYIMYFRRLKKIKDAIPQANINQMSNFLIELIQIVEELNRLDIAYWDFHSNNVLVDKKGMPFLLDVDDIEYKAEKELLYRQIEYLIEFIFNVTLSNNYSLIKTLKSEALNGILSKKTLNFIQNIINKDPNQSLILPYDLVEELKDKEKIHIIKRKLK